MVRYLIKTLKHFCDLTIIHPASGKMEYPALTDYKNHVRAENPEIAKDIDEAEAISQIIGTMIERRHDLNLSQRDLAALCGLPHSSVARIESGKSIPNLSTLLKIFRELGLCPFAAVEQDGMPSTVQLQSKPCPAEESVPTFRVIQYLSK